jgi:hypothetical protein
LYWKKLAQLVSFQVGLTFDFVASNDPYHVFQVRRQNFPHRFSVLSRCSTAKAMKAVSSRNNAMIFMIE